MEIESLKYEISQFEEQNKALKQQNNKLVFIIIYLFFYLID